jgi:hypothetical protein
MSTFHKSECPAATGHHAPNQNNNNSNYPTSNCLCKEEATLFALLALAGHPVHPLRSGGYLVAKWCYSYHAADIGDLRVFAMRLGVCK